MKLFRNRYNKMQPEILISVIYIFFLRPEVDIPELSSCLWFYRSSYYGQATDEGNKAPIRQEAARELTQNSTCMMHNHFLEKKKRATNCSIAGLIQGTCTPSESIYLGLKYSKAWEGWRAYFSDVIFAPCKWIFVVLIFWLSPSPKIERKNNKPIWQANRRRKSSDHCYLPMAQQNRLKSCKAGLLHL